MKEVKKKPFQNNCLNVRLWTAEAAIYRQFVSFTFQSKGSRLCEGANQRSYHLSQSNTKQNKCHEIG